MMSSAPHRLLFPGGRDGDDGGIQVISGDTVGSILVLRVFLGVGGGNNNDSTEDSWSRCVLLFYLGLELLCFPWDGSSIRVGGLVDGGLLFRLGGFALPRPDTDCLELLLLFSEDLALRSAAQRRWRGGGERLRSLTAEGLLRGILAAFLCGVSASSSGQVAAMVEVLAGATRGFS